MKKIEKSSQTLAKFSLTHFQAKPTLGGREKKNGKLDFLMAEPCVSSSVCAAKILEPQLEGRPVVWNQAKRERKVEINQANLLD